MKILYVSPYPPARDGIGDYVRSLAGALRADGHELRVVLPRPMPGAGPDVLGSVSWRSRAAADVHHSAGAFGPDVVHLQFAIAAFGLRTLALPRWLAALRRELGVPVVVTMHEVTRDTALLRAAGRAVYRRIARHCDKIIVHTAEASAAVADTVGIARGCATVIPHPAARPPADDVQPAELRARFGLADASILLAFGFIHVDKGLPDLIRALGLLRRSGRLPAGSVRLAVAGDVRRRNGPFRVLEARDRLHRRRALWLARRHGVRDHLVLPGYVPDREVTAWFRLADAAILPYRRIEQSGVAALAIAFGVPALASQVGGLVGLFGTGPWTFPARSPDRIAAALDWFLAASPELRAAAVANPTGLGLPAVAAATLSAYAEARATAAGGLARVG
jgi:glycosyltransferase involved in cell wall biosynthesis